MAREDRRKDLERGRKERSDQECRQKGYLKITNEIRRRERISGGRGGKTSVPSNEATRGVEMGRRRTPR